MILHCDMDAFYASVEEPDDPRLAGKAVVVGVSGLYSCPSQWLLFDADARQRQRQLAEVADRVQKKFGGAALGRTSRLAREAHRKPRPKPDA